MSSETLFSPAAARNLRLRSELMTALRHYIERERLTQADAAGRLKVSQPRISDLTRGKISRSSLDTLVNMLTDAGSEVAVKIRRPARRVVMVSKVESGNSGGPILPD